MTETFIDNSELLARHVSLEDPLEGAQHLVFTVLGIFFVLVLFILAEGRNQRRFLLCIPGVVKVSIAQRVAFGPRSQAKSEDRAARSPGAFAVQTNLETNMSHVLKTRVDKG